MHENTQEFVKASFSLPISNSCWSSGVKNFRLLRNCEGTHGSSDCWE